MKNSPWCCESPNLELLKSLYDKPHDSEEVRRCASCGASWFHRWHEMIEFGGGADSITSWYSRISEDECRALLATETRPDLAFLGLRTRPAIQVDETGICEVMGQPEHAWT